MSVPSVLCLFCLINKCLLINICMKQHDWLYFEQIAFSVLPMIEYYIFSHNKKIDSLFRGFSVSKTIPLGFLN